MSEVEVEPSELLGIPGYALNVEVPGAFALPVPSEPAGAFSRAGSVVPPVSDAAVRAPVDEAEVAHSAEPAWRGGCRWARFDVGAGRRVFAWLTAADAKQHGAGGRSPGRAAAPDRRVAQDVRAADPPLRLGRWVGLSRIRAGGRAGAEGA